MPHPLAGYRQISLLLFFSPLRRTAATCNTVDQQFINDGHRPLVAASRK